MENLREDFKSGYIFPQNYFESEYASFEFHQSETLTY